MSKYITTLLFALCMDLAVFQACTGDNYNKSAPLNAKNAQLSTVDNIVISENVYFSESLYRSYQDDSSLFIIDERFCQVLLLDKQFNITAHYTKKDIDQIPGCYHSFMKKNEDSTHFLFIKGLNRLLTTSDEGLISSKRLKVPETIIDLNKYLPSRFLGNQNLIVPIAENIMKDPQHYSEKIGIPDLKKYMKSQNLFALYDKHGNFIKTFGKFPAVFLNKGLRYTSPHSYYYTINDKSLYVCFPIDNIIYEYDLNGNLKNKLILNLPDFNYVEGEEKGLIDTITGFSLIQDTFGEAKGFYFMTVEKTANKLQQYIYKYNLGSDSIKKAEFNLKIPGMILSPSTDNELSYLTMPWNEKPLRLIKLLIE